MSSPDPTTDGSSFQSSCCDGRRNPLLELNESQVEGLRWLAREQGAPIPP